MTKHSKKNGQHIYDYVHGLRIVSTMKLKSLMAALFSTQQTEYDRQDAQTERIENTQVPHQRPRRRSSVMLYTAQTQLSHIIQTEQEPYYKVQQLGKDVVLTSSIVLSVLFFETLAPIGYTYLIVPLLQGIVESKKETHSLAVLSDILFDFMIPCMAVLPLYRTDIHMMSHKLATTIVERIKKQSGETKEALASAQENILPRVESFLNGTYVNTIVFTLPIV